VKGFRVASVAEVQVEGDVGGAVNGDGEAAYNDEPHTSCGERRQSLLEVD
jgi:hypothetical protein